MPERRIGTIGIFKLAEGEPPYREFDTDICIDMWPDPATGYRGGPLFMIPILINTAIDNGYKPEEGDDVEVELDQTDAMRQTNIYSLNDYSTISITNSGGDAAEGEGEAEEDATDNSAPHNNGDAPRGAGQARHANGTASHTNGHAPEAQVQNGHANGSAPSTNGNAAGGEGGSTGNGA